MKFVKLISGSLAVLMMVSLTSCVARSHAMNTVPNETNASEQTAVTQMSARNTSRISRNYISEAAAKRIAFKHAGVTEQNVYALTVKLERDNGRMVYDVDFKSNGYEFEVDVDAINGTVLSFEKEPVSTPKPKPTATPKPTNTPRPTNVPRPTNPPTPTYIGKEAAKNIAFKRAGIAENEVTFVRVEFDYEHGRAIYEVEFKARGYEYDVDVDAITGAVLSFDVGIDDDAPRPTQPPAPTAAPTPAPTPTPTQAHDYIGEEAAKRIAFERAGISAGEARFVKVELDYEHGRPIYEVEFKARGYEYEVDIDAVTGTVLDFDVEFDD